MSDQRIMSILSCLGPYMNAAQNQELSDISDELTTLRARIAELEKERDDALSAAGITHGVYPELYKLRAENAQMHTDYSQLCKDHANMQFDLSREHELRQEAITLLEVARIGLDAFWEMHHFDKVREMDAAIQASKTDSDQKGEG